MPVRTGPRITDLLVYLVGIVVLSGALTVLWLSMRAVMDIGGMCASGGPYVVAVECPEAVAWLLPLSIFAGIGGVGLIAWFGSRIGSGFAAVATLAWPALFLSLGWNFLEYGLASPGGWDISWLICGVLFVLMGGVPLVVGIQGLRRGSRGSRSSGAGGGPGPRPATGSSAGGSRSAVGSSVPSSVSVSATAATSAQRIELAQLLRQIQGATIAQAGEVTVGEATGIEPTGGHLVDQLERLARLRDQGALGEAEYLRAKQAVIEAAARGTTA